MHEMQPPFPHIDIDRLVDAAKLCYPRIGTKDQNRNQFGSIQILGKEPSSNLVPSTGPQIEGVTKIKAQAPLEGPIKKKKKISKGVEVRDVKEENEKVPMDVNKVPSEKKKKKKSSKEAEVLAFKQIPTGEAEIQVVLEVTGEKKKKKKKVALANDVLVEKKKKKSKSKETKVQVVVEIAEKKKKETKEIEVPQGVNEVPKVEKKKKKKSKETDAVQKAEITVEKKKKKKHSAPNPVSGDKEKKKKTDCAPAAQ